MTGRKKERNKKLDDLLLELSREEDAEWKVIEKESESFIMPQEAEEKLDRWFYETVLQKDQKEGSEKSLPGRVFGCSRKVAFAFICALFLLFGTVFVIGMQQQKPRELIAVWPQENSRQVKILLSEERPDTVAVKEKTGTWIPETLPAGFVLTEEKEQQGRVMQVYTKAGAESISLIHWVDKDPVLNFDTGWYQVTDTEVKGLKALLVLNVPRKEVNLIWSQDSKLFQLTTAEELEELLFTMAESVCWKENKK